MSDHPHGRPRAENRPNEDEDAPRSADWSEIGYSIVMFVPFGFLTAALFYLPFASLSPFSVSVIGVLLILSFWSFVVLGVWMLVGFADWKASD